MKFVVSMLYVYFCNTKRIEWITGGTPIMTITLSTSKVASVSILIPMEKFAQLHAVAGPGFKGSTKTFTKTAKLLLYVLKLFSVGLTVTSTKP